MDHNKSLREHLVYLLKGGGAHLHFDAAIADLPIEIRGAAGDPHSPWPLARNGKGGIGRYG
jgi:hypothetical protein